MKTEKEIIESYKKWKEIYADELNSDEFKSHVKVMLNTFEFVLNHRKETWTK